MSYEDLCAAFIFPTGAEITQSLLKSSKTNRNLIEIID